MALKRVPSSKLSTLRSTWPTRMPTRSPGKACVAGCSDNPDCRQFELEGAAQLVGVGFRCWVAGYQTGDIDCWETAWNTYAVALGPKCAKRAVGELSSWVRTIRGHATRKIEVYPAGCRRFCRDECMAAAMVAACQASVCPALRACTYALLEQNNLEAVLDSTEDFAGLLRDMDLVLPVELIERATPLALSGDAPPSARTAGRRGA